MGCNPALSGLGSLDRQRVSVAAGVRAQVVRIIETPISHRPASAGQRLDSNPPRQRKRHGQVTEQGAQRESIGFRGAFGPVTVAEGDPLLGVGELVVVRRASQGDSCLDIKGFFQSATVTGRCYTAAVAARL